MDCHRNPVGTRINDDLSVPGADERRVWHCEMDGGAGWARDLAGQRGCGAGERAQGGKAAEGVS